MRNTIFATAALSLVALLGCAAEEAEEPTSTTTDALDAACIREIKAPAGSQEWLDALRECLREGASSSTPGGGNVSCTQSVSCVNGTCRCGSGPNKGKTCDGSVTTGATSCSVLCKVCE